MDPACTDPIWKDACEPDGVRNTEGVLIASLRLLTELVDEPPKDGPSYGLFPTGNAIIPARCEPDGVRNADGVLIPSRRLLAELVDEPPKDGPSYGSFPTGNAIIPDR